MQVRPDRRPSQSDWPEGGEHGDQYDNPRSREYLEGYRKGIEEPAGNITAVLIGSIVGSLASLLMIILFVLVWSWFGTH